VRLTLLHNPKAGEEDHNREGLEAMLAGAGHDVAYRSLKDDDWSEALDDDVDLIVVAGGDGSVRKLFTALRDSPTLALIVPLGSANNIARTLGLDLDSAMRMLIEPGQHSRRRFDLWDVTSAWGTSRCVEAVGGGVFSRVLAKAEDAPADPTGSDKVDFGLELLAESLAEAPPRRWTFEIDGERIEDELIGVEAMNIREIGANLLLADGSDPSDGLLDVVVVRPDDRAALAVYAGARQNGEDVAPPRLSLRRGRQVVLEPPREVRLHVDDVLPAWDLSSTSWVEIVAADVRLDLLVPG
jgi:diacylglycerol kinase family enzyme